MPLVKIAELKKEFHDRFHKDTQLVFFCPGRVNLIGEHIDYNGGRVMPCAISLGTYLIIAKNEEKTLNFQSLNFTEKASISLQPAYEKTGKEWFNYPLGVVHELQQQGFTLSGLDMLFYGDLPVGAGLSSSASIEVLTSFALATLFNLPVVPRDMAILSKKVENEFIGMNCGIMDQFAVAMGKKDSAILLDCDTLAYEYLPFNTGEHVLAIINSNKQRKLTDSKYNERFAECRKALDLLKKELSIQHLCDISPAIFEIHKHLLNDAVLEKRALHVVTENQRVNEAGIALQEGRLKKFGELMFASHESLKQLYEVSGKELDVIVEFSKTYPSCIGARMTGAGFGGCAIALVNKNDFEDFSKKLTIYYTEKIGYAPEVFGSEIGHGARELEA